MFIGRCLAVSLRRTIRASRAPIDGAPGSGPRAPAGESVRVVRETV